MLIATGSALGAVIRYILTLISKTLFVTSIYGTISVNIIGSFLIGYLITSNFSNNLSENFIRFFLVIGLLGSFTTFSAFSYEVIDLLNSKKYITSFTYVFISIFICIMSAYLGTLLNKFWFDQEY